MSMSYNEAFVKFKSDFGKEEWKTHEKCKKKLKKFSKLNFARGIISPIEKLEAENEVFTKKFRFIALSQIYNNAEAVRNFRMINELLIPIFCRQIGLEAATYLPFTDFGKETCLESMLDVMKKVNVSNGLASVNFLKDGEQLCDLDLFDYSSKSGYNMKGLLETLKDLQRKNPQLKIDMNDIKTKFFKLIVLDLLTLQLDRHEGNLPLIQNDKDNSIRFGLVFDNEYGFNIKALGKYNLEKDEIGLLRDDGKIDVKKFIVAYNNRLRRGDDYIWTITPNCNQDYLSCMREIVAQANVSQTANKILLEVLQNLNVEKAFTDIKEMGIEVSPQYKAFVSQIVGFGKAKFAKEMSRFSSSNIEESSAKGSRTSIEH